MKKVILPSIFLAVLSTPAFEKVIHAEENESTLAVSNQIQYVKVNSGNLILRANASTTSNILAKLAKGTEVNVQSISNGWAKIVVNGKTGYVSTAYLTTTKPSYTSASNTPAPTQTTKKKFVKVSAGSYLNMRSSASTSSPVVAKLSSGTEVNVYSEKNGWAEVEANGIRGFVSTGYLANTKITSTTEQSTPTVPKPTLSVTTKFVDISSGSYLNMRVNPSTTSKVLAKLSSGTEVKVYSEAHGWSKIEADGKQGYVSSSYLSNSRARTDTPNKPSAPAPVPTTTNYVNVSKNSHLNLRSSSSNGSNVLAKLKSGTVVEVLSVESGWAKIKVDGKEGFVSKKYLSNTAIVTTNNPAPAKPVKSTTLYVKVDSRLNLRSDTSTTSNIIARLENGTAVEVYSMENGWARVKVDGKEGYLSTSYLFEAPPNTETAPNAPVEQAEPETTVKYVNVDHGSILNMRNRPSTNASIVIKLARGIEVTVISEENGWSKILAYGQEGYVNNKYLSSGKPGTSQGSGTPTELVKEQEPPKPNPVESSPEEESTNPSTQEPNLGSEPTVPNDSEPGSEQAPTNPGIVLPEDQDGEPESEQTPGAEAANFKYVDVSPGSSLNIRLGPSTKTDIITKLAPGTAVTVLSEENGWAKVTANGKTGYVSAEYLKSKATVLPSHNINTVYTEYNITVEELTNIQMQANPQTDQKYTTYIREDALKTNSQANPTSGVVQGSSWRVRGGAGTDFWAVGKVNKGETLRIKSIVKGTDGYNWYEIDYNRSWVNASPEDVAYYLEPDNFIQNPVSSFQFLKLSETTGLEQFEVNERILAGKGILQGHAATFIAASEKYGVNDMYLISHALLETGNGKSQLANGVEIYGKTVYNMFGIGAYDGSAVESGAKFAFEHGWFSPVEAIIGGAEFIASGYISKGQDTIYKMRWNPEAAAATGVANHQYATDIGWATKQVNQIHNLYSLLDSYKITLDLPLYKRF